MGKAEDKMNEEKNQNELKTSQEACTLVSAILSECEGTKCHSVSRIFSELIFSV